MDSTSPAPAHINSISVLSCCLSSSKLSAGCWCLSLRTTSLGSIQGWKPEQHTIVDVQKLLAVFLNTALTPAYPRPCCCGCVTVQLRWMPWRHGSTALASMRPIHALLPANQAHCPKHWCTSKVAILMICVWLDIRAYAALDATASLTAGG